MHKELNPELFGEKKVTQEKPSHYAQQPSVAYAAPELNFLNTDRQILELKNQNQQLHDHLAKLTQSFNEAIRGAHLKIEKLQQAQARLEQNHNGLALEAGQKMTALNQKVNERRSLDLKVQEMVDRHNNLIKSFEVRLNHLQKLLAEKDAQLVATQSALNETKMELARLKRF